MEIISTTRTTINSIRLKSADCVDESIKLLSNFGASIRLPRNHQDDFSWDKDGLFVIKNTSEQDCTLTMTLLQTTGLLVIWRSSRCGAATLSAGDSVTRKIRGGEAWTLRANNAEGKGTANL